jgi:Protein of unknown function (DUF2797)
MAGLIPTPMPALLCDAAAKRGSQCDACSLADGGQRRFLIPGPGEHAVYLASFGAGLTKVGITRWDRRLQRLSEQGAVAAIVVARCPTGATAKRLEDWWRRVGVRDRYSASERLVGLVGPAASQEALQHELLELLALHRRRLDNKWWLPTPEQVDLPAVPVLARAPQLLRLRDDLVIRGRVEAICARTIILRETGSEDDGQLVAVPTAGLVGWQLRELADETEIEPRQMELFAA